MMSRIGSPRRTNHHPETPAEHPLAAHTDLAAEAGKPTATSGRWSRHSGAEADVEAILESAMAATVSEILIIRCKFTALTKYY